MSLCVCIRSVLAEHVEFRRRLDNSVLSSVCISCFNVGINLGSAKTPSMSVTKCIRTHICMSMFSLMNRRHNADFQGLGFSNMD